VQRCGGALHANAEGTVPLLLHRFTSLSEARTSIGEFIVRYNTEWLIERLGQWTPAAARAAALAA
jgi:hypothetical protein